MIWRATVPCSRAQGESIADLADPFINSKCPPVLVADEPNADAPDAWLIHAYFDRQPTSDEIEALTRLGKGPPRIEQFGSEDWVSMSQAGIRPIRAGRFHVHTPSHAPDRSRTNFEIDAGLAFGTGHHATTAGCLEALDNLEQQGAEFANIADIGTGTGLLAFAALTLWPAAKCVATDIDPVAIDVARDNAVINGVRLGDRTGELLLTVAQGMDAPVLAARSPFDLIIANILAQPLIELAPHFCAAIARNGTILLAGILGTQTELVARAYEKQGLSVVTKTTGEWPILILQAERSNC